MRTLDDNFITEKNKQENSPIFLYTLYDYDGNGNNLYFAEWHENVVFDGIDYTKFPIRHDFVGENTQGEIDQITISLANVSRLIQAYLEDYDLRGKKVSIKIVWSNHLDDADNYTEDIYYIDTYTADEQNVVLTLTSKFDVLETELPSRMFLRNFCTWKFKSTECGYTGGAASCNKTLTTCRNLQNNLRFGGFPSIPSKRVYFSV